MDKSGGHQSARRTAAMASLRVGTHLGYQAAIRGATTPAGVRVTRSAQVVIKENNPSSAGVVRRIARSDHCRTTPTCRAGTTTPGWHGADPSRNRRRPRLRHMPAHFVARMGVNARPPDARAGERHQPSCLHPDAPIFSAVEGRLSTRVSCAGAAGSVSCSSAVVRSTHIALGWIGATMASGSVVREANSSCLPSILAGCPPTAATARQRRTFLAHREPVRDRKFARQRRGAPRAPRLGSSQRCGSRRHGPNMLAAVSTRMDADDRPGLAADGMAATPPAWSPHHRRHPARHPPRPQWPPPGRPRRYRPAPHRRLRQGDRPRQRAVQGRRGLCRQTAQVRQPGAGSTKAYYSWDILLAVRQMLERPHHRYSHYTKSHLSAR